MEEGAIHHDLTLINSSGDDAQDRQPHLLFDTRTVSRHSLPKSTMSQLFLTYLVFCRFSTRQVSQTQTAPSTLRHNDGGEDGDDDTGGHSEPEEGEVVGTVDPPFRGRANWC